MLDLNDPIAVLLAATEAFAAQGLPYAAYGGLALAAYGEPRETKDADLAVVGTTAGEGREALLRAGHDAILTFDRAPFGGNWVSRITLLSSDVASGLNTVDLVEPRSPRFARAALDRAIEGTLRGRSIQVLSPEDFVLFKVLSTRERDLEDAATVVRALGPRLERDLIAREADALAAEIPDHDTPARLARVLASARC